MTQILPAPVYLPVPNNTPGQLDANYTINFGLDPNWNLTTTGSFNGYNVEPVTLHVYNPNNSPFNITIGGATTYIAQNSITYLDITGVNFIQFLSNSPIVAYIDLLNYAVPLGSQNITSLSQSSDPLFSDVIGLYHFTQSNNMVSFVDNSTNGFGTMNTGVGSLYPIISTNESVFGSSSLSCPAIVGGGGAATSVSTATISAVPNFCIEFWLNMGSVVTYSGNFSQIISSGTNGANFNVNVAPVSASQFQVKFNAYGGGFGGFPIVVNNSYNTWNHYALCILGGASGGTTTLYFNGVLYSSIQGTSDSAPTAATLIINDLGYTTLSYNLNDLRITNNVRYTNSFTPFKQPFPNNS